MLFTNDGARINGSMEIVLFSSEPNPYKLAFKYKMLIFYKFMTVNCEITQVLIESNCI